jgi:hypothetical protein
LATTAENGRLMDFEKTFATCPICYGAVQEHLMANHINFHVELEKGGEDEEIIQPDTRYTIEL